MLYLLILCVGIFIGVWLAYSPCRHEWKEWGQETRILRRQCIHCKKIEWRPAVTISESNYWRTGLPYDDHYDWFTRY